MLPFCGLVRVTIAAGLFGSAMARPLTRMSSVQSADSASSCLSSAFSSIHNIGGLRSGKEWWTIAVAKGLLHLPHLPPPTGGLKRSVLEII